MKDRETGASRVLGMIALLLTAVAVVPRAATAQYRYKVDIQNNARVFVIAYNAMTYTVNNGSPIAIAAESVQKVNLTGITGPLATITLSSSAGYVYTTSDTAAYVGENESNDRMILVRGKTSYTDTEFLVYNTAMVVGGKSPGKMVITAMAKDANVTITDLTNGTDNESGRAIKAGLAYVKNLSDPSLLRVRSDNPISVYHGIFKDGHTEIMPTTNGGLVGALAYVASPQYVAVVAMGNGTITISDRGVDLGTGEVYEQVRDTRTVTKGQGIFLPELRSTDPNNLMGYFSGVTALKISGTAPFYSFIGMGTEFSTYFGGTFIPPDPDPAYASFTHYYFQSLHPGHNNKLDVLTYEDGTTVTLRPVGGGTALTPTSSTGGLLVYDIPKSTLRPGDEFGGLVTTTYELTANKPVTIRERHQPAEERGSMVLSPDFVPPSPPSIGAFDVTSVQVVPNASQLTQRTFYLRLNINLLDVNADLVSFELKNPRGEVIAVPEQYITRTPAGAGPYSRIEIKTGNFDLSRTEFLPGTYTIKATDQGGLERVGQDVIRNLSLVDILKPAINNIPGDRSTNVPTSPIYAWFPPATPYAGNYRIQVSSDSTFAKPDSFILKTDQTFTQDISIAQATLTTKKLNNSQSYFWRVFSTARTLDWGEDIVVVGPTWRFGTAGLPDVTPPEFPSLPSVLSTNVDTITIQWSTNEPARAIVRFGAPGWTTALGQVEVPDYTLSHTLKMITGVAPGQYTFEVEAFDAQGNARKSPRVQFKVTPLPDRTPPTFTSGPELTSVTQIKARITWGTSEPAGGQINWYIKGIDPVAQRDSVKEMTALDKLTLTKEFELTDLTPDTVYFYQAKAIDAANNLTTTSLLRFRTRAARDTIPPKVIGKVEVVSIGVNNAILAWKTNEGAYSKVLYGTVQTNLNQAQANVADVLLQEHRIELTGLTENTTYYYSAVSLDASRNADTTRAQSFTTRLAPDVTPPPILPYGPNKANQGLVLGANAGQGRPVPRAQWSSSEDNTGFVEVCTDSTRGPDSLFVKRDSVVTFNDPSYAHEHKVDLEGLQAGKAYYAVIVARDRANNVSKGILIGFSTPGVPVVDTTPPSVDPNRSSFSGGEDSWQFKLVLTEPADARIFYGVQHYALNEVKASLVKQTEHNILLQELQPATEYFYKRVLTDVAGNIYEDSAPLSFITLARPDTTPPQIVEGPQIVRTDRSVNFQWSTDEQTNAKVYYRPAASTGFAEFVTSTNILSRRHSVTIENLVPNTAYDWAIVLTDAAGNETKFPETTVLAKEGGGVRLVKLARDAQGRQGAGTFTTSPNPDITPPIITGGPTVLSRSKNAVVLGWSTDEPADSRVRFGESGGAGKPARAGGDTLTNQVVQVEQVVEHKVVITGLAEAGTYAYEVASTDLSGNGETVSTKGVFTTTAETDVTAPVITEGPTIISKTDTRAVVKWTTDEMSDSQVDVLEHGLPLDQRTTISVPDLVKDHVITVTNLKASTLYDVLASSVDASQNGPVTALISFTTEQQPDKTPPVVTQAPVVETKDDVSAKIAWRTNEPADTYIDYGTSTSYGMVAQELKRDTTHALTLTKLTAGTKYYYRIQAEDGSGNVYVQSTASEFTTDAAADLTPPATPQDFALVAGDKAIYLSWKANTEPDFAGYTIERSTDNATFAPIATQYQGTSYLDRSVTNNTTYYYRINAVDNSRNANKSAYATASGKPEAGLAPQAPALTDYLFDPGSATPGYPIFTYYKMDTRQGEPFRPVFRIGNVPTITRVVAKVKMSYTFVVATDSAFKTIIATGSNVAPGDTIIGTMETWVYAISSLDPSLLDTTKMTHVPDSTSWIPTRNLTPGVDYYWRVRANDGIFDGPWSETRVVAQSPVILLHPGRAAYFNIPLRPEEPPAPKPTAVQLAAFTADGKPSGIRVAWEIRHDGEAQGVHLLRSTNAENVWSYRRVSEELMPLKGEFLDISARPGVIYHYRLEVELQDGTSTIMGIASGQLLVPTRFALGNNRPNPFNPVTVIPYALPGKSEVTLNIYDVTGRLVRTLVNHATQEAGFYQVVWDGTDQLNRQVGSGVYLYRLERIPANGGPAESLLERMVLIR